MGDNKLIEELRDIGTAPVSYKPLQVLCAQAADRIAAQAKELEEVRAERARCHARLEIDHCYRFTNAGQEECVDIPMEDRREWPDGIECRDDTIKLLEARLAALEAREKKA